jgi:DinB superfamily
MDLDEVTTMLATTPAVLHTLLGGVSPQWLHRDDGPGTWSAYDIVGHLLHGEVTDWVPRTRMIVEHGTGRPFERYDREAMRAGGREPAARLLARFEAARQDSLEALATMDLGAADLDRRGLHPDLGEVTFGQLMATWLAHDLTHLAQVGEVLAGRYRHEVGPWRAYLPALDRAVAAE